MVAIAHQENDQDPDSSDHCSFLFEGKVISEALAGVMGISDVSSGRANVFSSSQGNGLEEETVQQSTFHEIEIWRGMGGSERKWRKERVMNYDPAVVGVRTGVAVWLRQGMGTEGVYG